jgi:hypothetical protein
MYNCSLPPNPTRAEIDEYVVNFHNTEELKYVVREIRAKESVGALLHPCEQYLIEKFQIK